MDKQLGRTYLKAVVLVSIFMLVRGDIFEDDGMQGARAGRSISNIARLLLGGNVPPDHPLVKYPDSIQSASSSSNGIVASVPGMTGSKSEYSPLPSFPQTQSSVLTAGVSPSSSTYTPTQQQQQLQPQWQQTNQGYLPVQHAQLTVSNFIPYKNSYYSGPVESLHPTTYPQQQQTSPSGINAPGHNYNAALNPFNAPFNTYPSPGNPYNAPYHESGRSFGTQPSATNGQLQPGINNFGSATTQQGTYATPSYPAQQSFFNNPSPIGQYNSGPTQPYNPTPTNYQPTQSNYPQTSAGLQGSSSQGPYNGQTNSFPSPNGNNGGPNPYLNSQPQPYATQTNNFASPAINNNYPTNNFSPTFNPYPGNGNPIQNNPYPNSNPLSATNPLPASNVLLPSYTSQPSNTFNSNVAPNNYPQNNVYNAQQNNYNPQQNNYNPQPMSNYNPQQPLPYNQPQSVPQPFNPAQSNYNNQPLNFNNAPSSSNFAPTSSPNNNYIPPNSAYNNNSPPTNYNPLPQNNNYQSPNPYYQNPQQQQQPPQNNYPQQSNYNPYPQNNPQNNLNTYNSQSFSNNNANPAQNTYNSNNYQSNSGSSNPANRPRGEYSSSNNNNNNNNNNKGNPPATTSSTKNNYKANDDNYHTVKTPFRNLKPSNFLKSPQKYTPSPTKSTSYRSKGHTTNEYKTINDYRRTFLAKTLLTDEDLEDHQILKKDGPDNMSEMELVPALSLTPQSVRQYRSTGDYHSQALQHQKNLFISRSQAPPNPKVSKKKGKSTELIPSIAIFHASYTN